MISEHLQQALPPVMLWQAMTRQMLYALIVFGVVRLVVGRWPYKQNNWLAPLRSCRIRSLDIS